MADRGNLEWIAATLGDIKRSMAAANDQRIDSFTGLLSSIESSLADLVGNIEKGGGAQAIEAMAKALSSIRMPEISYAAPAITVKPTPVNVDVAAPNVTVQAPVVNVEAPNVAVEALMPELPAELVALLKTALMPKPAWTTLEVRMPGQYGAPDKIMTITRKA